MRRTVVHTYLYPRICVVAARTVGRTVCGAGWSSVPCPNADVTFRMVETQTVSRTPDTDCALTRLMAYEDCIEPRFS
jgi:hypothetical protein